MSNSQVKDMTELIEDWLDNDHHSARLPISVSFEDIQTVARLLAPRICNYIVEDITVISSALMKDENA